MPLQNYEKTVWEDADSTATPLDARHLNNAENGIERVTAAVQDLESICVPELIAGTVTDWLEEHPEATTTVQDESLTANKLVKGTLGYVMPENFGAIGDGVADDTEAVQAAVDHCAENGFALQLKGGSKYKVSGNGIIVSKPISLYGNGATLLGSTFNPILTLNFDTYNPKWTTICDLKFDLDDKAQSGLRIINTRNIICRDLVFSHFENKNITGNNFVAGIYETGDYNEGSGGYERYFDTIVFYPDVDAFEFGEEWAKHIYCVYTDSAGDDCWNNIVCHTCPRPFRMYNWTTMMNNIHLVGDSKNLLRKPDNDNEKSGCAFDLRGTGPYLMNNIYIDSCPYGFKKSKDSSLIASNVTMINPKSGDDLCPSKLFYIAGASSRHVLATAHINGFNAKYGNVALTGYPTGAALLDIKIANPENILGLKSEGESFNFGGAWNTDYFDGELSSLRLVNHFDGTFSIRGKLTAKQAVSGVAGVKVKTLPSVRIPGEVYITFSDGTTVLGCNGFDYTTLDNYLELKALNINENISLSKDATAYVDIPVAVIENVHAPWNEIQAAVKNGNAPTKYPVGTEFGVRISGYGEARFVVLGHDQVQSVKNDKPGMISSIAIQYDSETGRLFTAPKGLAARQYYFVWDSTLDLNLNLSDGKWLFKLNNDIPEDGYITISVPQGSNVPVLNTYDKDGEDPIESGIELTYYEDPRHTMLLGLKNVLSDNSGSAVSVQYDAPEALYYAPNELAAGKHYFTWSTNVGIASGNYWFELTKSVPKGGQITIDVSAMEIKTYGSVGSTEVIDTVTLNSGTDGNRLGSTVTSIAEGATYTGNMNQAYRCVNGNDNYAQSAVRQLINSESLKEKVWKPTHKFDRPPAWAGTLDGLVYALDNSFVNALRYAVVKCRTNGTFEISDTSNEDGIFRKGTDYILKDRFFLLSRSQIFGTGQGVIDEGEQVTHYIDKSAEQRISTDNSNVAQTCFARSYKSVSKLHTLGSDGDSGEQYAKEELAVMPCCIIA